MRQIVAGNWKMNGLTGEAAALAQGIRAGVGAAGMARDLIVFPPATQLAAVASLLRGSGIGVGGQDCSHAARGAHTGDISADMLRDLGCTHVILGHSERRRDHAETDERVREKVLAAVEAGLVPIVCVGETDEQRGGGQETETVGWQIAGSLPKPFTGILAYEPIWAIGTGRACGTEEVAAMHAFIREELVRQFAEAGRSVPILYGGSVKPDNAAGLLAVPEVGGALVGGASLDAASFLAIAQA
jgi:triosephosphate isomerase